MKLYMCNNHPVVRLAGEAFIIDTGSPCSFYYGGPHAIEAAGQAFLLCADPIADKETADELTGTDVAGFIGMDILQQTGLTIDLERGTLDFAFVEEEGCAGDYADLSISLPMGIYIVTDDLYLRRRLHGAIIDTGAWMPFVTSRLAGLLEPAGVQYADESPQFGSLRGEYLEGSITIPAADRDVSRRLRFGLLPDVLDRLGTFDAILGVTALTDKRLAFDFERKMLRIKL